MYKLLIAAAGTFVASASASASTAPNVPVELYFEALCPGCQDFTTGALKRTLAKPDMAAIIDLKLVAYGNTKQNADGSFECQHGADECVSDTYESCVEYKLSGNLDSIASGDTAMAAWPFILCMEEAEGAPSAAEGCYTSTMNTTSVAWSTIADCFANEADAVQTAAMKATPSHDYVPWVLVNGAVLENTNMLTKAVCDAYTGTPPASCSLPFEEVAAPKVDRCAN